MAANPTPYQAIKRKIIFDLLEKYKDTPTRTLARIAFRDHSEFFRDYEGARSYIRLYRGKNGDAMRKAIKSNQYFQP